MSLLKIAEGFRIDAVEYASRANAILGIRDSGKTYTATKLAEQLHGASIPFFAFDPIGRWRFLRSPGPKGLGFPIVVLGGAEPDIPMDAEKAPDIVRAAMRAGVSLVVDLYDKKWSKADWRKIVRGCFEAILYENESLGGGLRHVFLEEAAEFVPQRVDDGVTYAAVEKLARMGGNAGVGVTIINQRAEEVNKAVLELCDNLLLHRQRGKNSLASLKKWLTSVEGDVADITTTLANLPTGECWAWFREHGAPQRIKIAPKLSFDPNRRAMSVAGGAPMRRVDVSAFVAEIKSTLAGRPAAPVKQPKQQEADVKESEARALRAENVDLKRRVAELEKRNLRAGERPVGLPTTAAPTTVRHFDGDFDALYAAIKSRAVNDPGLLILLAQVPEINVTVTRKKIEMSEETLAGKCAILISAGFFDAGQTGHMAYTELKRRGASVAKPSVYREFDKIAALGFLTKEQGEGYRAVEGMKINVVEV